MNYGNGSPAKFLIKSIALSPYSQLYRLNIGIIDSIVIIMQSRVAKHSLEPVFGLELL